jgi:small GTP-binding protein
MSKDTKDTRFSNIVPDDIYDQIKYDYNISEDEKLITNKKVCVVGNVDAGKSSFIGTLSTNILDDGRGSARNTVCVHNHEKETGRTSDISSRIVKFPNGKTITLVDLCGHEKYFSTTASGISGSHPDYALVIISPMRGVEKMTKEHFRMVMSYNIPVCFVVTHVDMAQEKSCQETMKQIKNLCDFYKRKIEFLNSYDHYHSVKQGKDIMEKMNITSTTKFEDLNDDDLVEMRKLKDDEISNIKNVFKFKSDKKEYMDKIKTSLAMSSTKQSIIPAIFVSNVDGYCLDVMKNTLMAIDVRDYWNQSSNSTITKYFRKKLIEKKMQEYKECNNKDPDPKEIEEMKLLGKPAQHYGTTLYIETAYRVDGIGTVLSVVCRGDTVKINDSLYIGPINGKFHPIKIKSIHNDNRTHVKELKNHHFGCIAVKSIDSKFDIKKKDIKKGMVLISNLEKQKNVCFRFTASVSIMNTHSATLRSGYSPLIHVGTIRQTARMILDTEVAYDEKLTKRENKANLCKKIKAGDTEEVDFKFRFNSEYVEIGTIFVFRSGQIHGVGMITKVLPLKEDKDPNPDPVKKKVTRMKPTIMKDVSTVKKKAIVI